MTKFEAWVKVLFQLAKLGMVVLIAYCINQMQTLADIKGVLILIMLLITWKD